MIDSKNYLHLGFLPAQAVFENLNQPIRIVKRIWGSTVCRFALSLGASLGIRKITQCCSPTLYHVTLLACSVLHIFSNREQFFYEVTLAYPVMRSMIDSSWKWYHKILPPLDGKGGVFLGALPLKNFDHHQQLKSFAILSVLQDFELFTKTPWSDPVTPRDWEALGTAHKQIRITDLHPVSLKNLRDAVSWMEKNRSQGKNVYVHCKAGRSRSSSVVIAYLLYHWKREGLDEGEREKDVAKAIDYVRTIRPRIILFAEDRENIKGFYLSLNRETRV